MKYAIVDAFTQRAFSGNPAAVCLMESPLPDHLMQALAAEFNLSETAFVFPLQSNRWSLRWFTPTTEVNLCGHATLAAGHVLISEQKEASPLVCFETRSGDLWVEQYRQGYRLKLPITHCTPLASDALPNSLALQTVRAARAGEDWLIELASAQAVRDFVPPLADITALPIRGLIVTAQGEDCDIVSRFFAPAAGINEDPVTGSAHCALSDYWQDSIATRPIRARQLSKRGGELEVAAKDQSVWLTGDAVTVMTGQIRSEWLT
ncbi:PhzF family phenazine biosynthesis protein [Spongiibacter taiwanensis]|uniref:PhzF family phenazine biosynthesis protein n=1 Tax=Spongiibacter taiwanensis TaxID=1748242 RepID=UPI002035B780|nr:PhzF family phenazine biosynthesis isomerase [Spongiibacter taiwanensis]USA43070.1 PhzF family phenazine biosynthesis protein [Spongiibacter taiwanensis]